MILSQYTQILTILISIIIVFVIYIYGLFKTVRGSSPNKWNIVIGFTIATLFIIYLIFNTYRIEPKDWAQIMLMLGLVLVTTLYAVFTAKQANASVKMAEEMREQRVMASRPVIIQKAVPVEVIGAGLSDKFEIYNAGNGPAIELEVLLLDEEKKQLGSQRETFLRAGDTTIFYPYGLANHLNSTCYLLSRYQSVLSKAKGRKQTWYETWLPFEPVKSQSRDYIYAKPRELEFRNEVTEKTSY